MISNPDTPRHSYTTRLLATLMPANWYAKKDATISAILEALATDLRRLFETGITCEAGIGIERQFSQDSNNKLFEQKNGKFGWLVLTR